MVDAEGTVPFDELERIARRRTRGLRQSTAPWIQKLKRSVRSRDDRVPALVHEPMMARAEQNEVVELRLASVRPMLHVVGMEEAAVLTAGKLAAAIPRLERSTY